CRTAAPGSMTTATKRGRPGSPAAPRPGMTDTASHPKQLGVVRLDLLAHLLDRGRIVLHLLDLTERLAAGLLLDARMHRAQAADIDDELLGLRREAEA